MNWDKARSLFRIPRVALAPEHGALGASLNGEGRSGGELRPPETAPRRPPWTPFARRPARRTGAKRGGEAFVARATSICIASGKGGTGKSILTASLANLLSARGRTLIVDADLGVGDAHILQDVSPAHTFVDVVGGECSVRDVVEHCRGQVDLLAAGSGYSHMAELSEAELLRIACGLEELESDYRYILVDSAAGVSGQTLGFAAACDVVVLLTTPVLTAMTDAYAFLKVLLLSNPETFVLLVVNNAADEDEARRVGERIAEVSERFLGRGPRLLGWLPEDPAVRRASNRRAPVTVSEPDSEISRSLRRLAVRLIEESSRVHPGGVGRNLVRRLTRAT